MHRREFIQLTSALAGVGLLPSACNRPAPVAGEIKGVSASIGHLVRDGAVPGAPAETEQAGVVIIGGGISGLSALRRLHQQGHSNVVLLELEEHTGGNASCGSNAVSAYPWGAHYIPVPNNNLTEYLSFLEELGVITGYNAAGLPVYNEFYLCGDPQERLYINGSWQDGLIPALGVGAADRREIDRFLRQMHEWSAARGADGKDAFAIPVDASSKDSVFTILDTITMQQWLHQEGYTSRYLHWYIDYCTRDDFGTGADKVSAWAGIHYFACRKGRAANAARHDVLTWPQGNGWLAERLSAHARDLIRTHAPVTRVVPEQEGVTVHYYDVEQKQLKAIYARQCIVAIPQFVAARLLPDAAERMQLVHAHLQYTPWMVANLTVNELQERSGAPASWDNVIYNGPSLGYVDATQQQLQQLKPRRVLTYYRPLTNASATEERRLAQKRTHAEWVQLILDDLRLVHEDIDTRTERIDVMIHAHAMAQPLPHLIHGEVRQRLRRSVGNCIHFAHTDIAGVSIFEEAFYQGIQAADTVMAHLGTGSHA